MTKNITNIPQAPEAPVKVPFVKKYKKALIVTAALAVTLGVVLALPSKKDQDPEQEAQDKTDEIV